MVHPAYQAVVINTWKHRVSPVDLFARLPRRPGRFLLESQGGPADIARYSFLGHRPFLRFHSRGRRLALWEEGAVRQWEGDPLDAMESLLTRFAVPSAAGTPPLAGGAIGYFSYDLGRQIERLPATGRDDLGLPEVFLSFYDHLATIDHGGEIGYVVAVPLPGREAQSVTAAEHLARVIRAEFPPGKAEAMESGPTAFSEATAGSLVSNFTRAEYCRAVERALEYIRAGHIYQVNLAQRFSAPLTGGVESLYRRLRTANPAPFAAFLDMGDFQIVSASPERFLLYEPKTGRAETRPIKGTRPRGATPAEDARLMADLLASAKDTAELVMIVDLERNDLGRVCEYATVRVPDLRRLEVLPTVFHTVATVEGRLRPGTTRAELLRATFPGGSVTGAPKIRAMQIIEELEGLRRHVYCGAIGYLGFDGRVDLNIAIRTITVKGGRAFFHAGGGIVADSEPEAEYEETLHKARALAEALGFSVTGRES